jgi:hypothetical protein
MQFRSQRGLSLIYPELFLTPRPTTSLVDNFLTEWERVPLARARLLAWLVEPVARLATEPMPSTATTAPVSS